MAACSRKLLVFYVWHFWDTVSWIFFNVYVLVNFVKLLLIFLFKNIYSRWMQGLVIPGKLLTVACFCIRYFAIPLFQMILFLLFRAILLSYIPHLNHFQKSNWMDLNRFVLTMLLYNFSLKLVIVIIFTVTSARC